MSRQCAVCGRSSDQVDFHHHRDSSDGLYDACAYCSDASNGVRDVWGGGKARQFLRGHLAELEALRAADVRPWPAGKELAALYPPEGEA